jgi:chromosome segregation ATPase
MLEQYQQAVQDLKLLQKQLQDFHFQRSSFQSNLDSVKAKRIKVNDRILDCQDSDGVGKLVKQLETLDQESRLTNAKLDALQLRIEPAEEQLHQTLPKVEPPFRRLYRSLYQFTIQQEPTLLL